MLVKYRTSFNNDLKKLKSSKMLDRVAEIIEFLKNVSSIDSLSNIQKLKGEGNYYRIRIGSWRIGISLSGNDIELIRILPRKDIYKYFP